MFVFIVLILAILANYWYISLPIVLYFIIMSAAKGKEKQYNEQQTDQRIEPTLNTPVTTTNKRATFVFHNGAWYQLATYQQIQTVQRWELVK